jgi:hypothetical protein
VEASSFLTRCCRVMKRVNGWTDFIFFSSFLWYSSYISKVLRLGVGILDYPELLTEFGDFILP